MRVTRRNAVYLPLAVAGLTIAGLSLAASSAAAQNAAPETIKIGLVMPMTGTSGAVGREISDATKLYIAQHGDTVAGKKIELIIRDDQSIPDNAKRLAQELIVNDKVSFLGAGLTPSAMAMAPIATEGKVPTVVMVSGTSIVTEKSPYYVRTSFTLGQQSGIIADWAIKNGSKKAVSVLSDWAPGAEAGKVFADHFTKGGGEVLDTLKVPLANPDFSPFLQRARDLQPDTLFVFVPAGQAGTFARQFSERGLDKSGIKLIGPGDIVDDDDLPQPATGDALLGVVTAGIYSAAHPSQLNKDYVAAYQKASGHRANFISVGGYDGMNLIYEALKKTGGKTDADTIIEAVKGMTWESPRGTISIDPRTRDIVQNVYIRKVQKVDGQAWAIEFATFPAVKDPLKEATN
ncbi:MAG TPA: ABC transporter substrate-binding protein [Xanthobacteraceae bacterium]|jgi:branched-chain amino acid transport system substrate-binding protein|nr:ABC transporter substrate-binding protein [Xanthobacteraceae bacterium]